MLNRQQAQEIVLLPHCCQRATGNLTGNLTGSHTIPQSNLQSNPLICAWGRAGAGTWREDSGSVFAPEEVYFPTLLAILGDPPPTALYINSVFAPEEVYFPTLLALLGDPPWSYPFR